MALFRGYQGAVSCAGGPQPGVRQFASWFLGAYGGHTPAGANLGIYLCRYIPGSGVWSLHAEGRAFDAGTSPYGDAPWGWTLMNRLRAKSFELGIQAIIYDRRIWSGSRPDDGWRYYPGSNPHTGHGHIEFSWAAALDLTAEYVQRVVSGQPSGQPWAERLVGQMKLLDLSGVTGNRSTWVSGEDTETLQGLLLARKFGPNGLVNSRGAPDGIAGPATRKLLGQAQIRYGTGSPSNPSSPDYKAGEQTFRALLRIGA